MIEWPSVSIDFTASGNFRMLQSSGWSMPEPHGAWSVDSEATVIVMGLRAGAAHRVEILAAPFLCPPTLAGQTISAHCAGQELFSAHLKGPGEIGFTIPAQAVSAVGVAELTFRFPNAVAPRDVGASGDSRKLGFSFSRADFFPGGGETKNEVSDATGVPTLAPEGSAEKVVRGDERLRMNRESLYRCWKDLNIAVERYLTSPSARHPFMAKFFAFLGGDEQLYVQFVRSIQAAYESSIVKSLDDPWAASRIPPYTHRIWVTGDAVALPPQDLIDSYLSSTKNLPASTTHFFWTNNSSVRNHIEEKASAANCPNIVVVNISLFNKESLFPSVLKLIKDRKYVLAADTLKFLILHRFGGIYSDLGVLYDETVFNLVQTAEYGLIVSDSTFFQTSFVASTPGSDLVSIFLAVLNNPHALSAAYARLGDAVGSLDEVHIFAGLGFTACVLLFLSPSCRTVILPAQSSHTQWRSEQSWYGTEAKHGNVLVDRTAASVITNEQYDKAKELVSTNLMFFGDDKILKEQLRILLLTLPHFTENKTRLCRLFSFYGSDKAEGWHNYGSFYNYLLGRERGRAGLILEIVAGANRSHLSSAASEADIPGVSLRAWHEAFPLATVVGGVDDERLLFHDERIETSLIDQTRPETLDALLHKLGDRPLDLVVDDGVHTFEANMNVYRAAYPKLRPGGFLVIEDVRRQDVPRWAEVLAAADHVGAIVQLPHPKNHADNCLVLIPGRALQ